MIKSGYLDAFTIGTGGKKKMYRISRSEIHRMAEINLKDTLDEMVKKKTHNS